VVRPGLLWQLTLLAACAPAPRRHAGEASSLLRALPGPAPRGRSADEAATLNRSCERCHVEIASEWRTSFHARAHTDPAYQRALLIEPLAFCRGCHAPEAAPDEDPPEAAAALGVGCVTCHVVSGEILGAPSPRPPSAPHPVARDARLATDSACSNCHEFEFPDRVAGRPAELMQATVSEHARSRDSGTTCSHCHMPQVLERGAPHKSHLFAGGHDAELVQSALVAGAEPTEQGVRITLTPGRTGHAFPTGDLFRRLQVSAEAVGGEQQVIASASRILARHWKRQPGPFGLPLRTAVSDDRLRDAPLVVELELGAPAAQRLDWRVDYQRVDHPRSEDEHDVSIDENIEIASGTLEKAR